MRVLSTKLPLKSETAKTRIYETIVSWLKAVGYSCAVGEKFEQCENKSSVRIVEGYCTVENIETEKNGKSYSAFRMSHIFHGQTWDTDIITEIDGEENTLFLHVNCSGDATQFENAPHMRTEIIRAFINDDRIKQCELPISATPVIADYEMLDTLVGIINGTLKLPLPVVYASKFLNSTGYAIDVENLATRLAGVAYIVAEGKGEISYHLKEKTNKQNPFNGYIGIYYPNGISRKMRPNDALDKSVLNEIIRNVTAQVDKNCPPWDKFESDKRAEDAKLHKELFEESIKDCGSLESKLAAAKEEIYDLTEEVTILRFKNESFQAALNAKGIEESVIAKSEVAEFFDGEQHDLLITILKDALTQSGGFDTRRYELINSLLENNAYIGNGKEPLEVVKRVLSSGAAINKRGIADLERVGFKLVSDSPHYKFVYRGNERYWFTVSKTPSDIRSGKNNASDIIKRLSVYQ